MGLYLLNNILMLPHLCTHTLCVCSVRMKITFRQVLNGFERLLIRLLTNVKWEPGTLSFGRDCLGTDSSLVALELIFH